MAQLTSKKLGVTNRTVPLTELQSDERFDVMTLFDVLELVSDPLALLKSVRDHLNPNGIALLFTPNLDSVGNYALTGAVKPGNACRTSILFHATLFTRFDCGHAARYSGLSNQRDGYTRPVLLFFRIHRSFKQSPISF